MCCGDARNGKTTYAAVLPGYARGLAFHGKHAFVGLSTLREPSILDGLPIADRSETCLCGVVVDLGRGAAGAELRFESGCEELLDMPILSRQRWLGIIDFEKQRLDAVFIAPPGTWKT